MPETKKCEQCKREFSSSISSTDVKFITNLGKCEECSLHDKGLIKVGNHYVPWSYRNYLKPDGSEELTPEEHYEDVNAFFPKFSFDDCHKKWKIMFSGTDFGGHDVQEFTWYFDSLEDMMEEMDSENH